MNSENNSQYYMYIVVNHDLGMGKGKIAGQVGHAVHLAVESMLTSSSESNKNNTNMLATISDFVGSVVLNKRVPYNIKSVYTIWKNTGMAKVVLKASQSEMEALEKLPNTIAIRDCGRTQIAQNSLTAIAFYPDRKDNMQQIVGKYKLL